MDKPGKLTLRAYNVGFGDCFLLTFYYQDFARHILIDFGSSGREDSTLLERIAYDIFAQCDGKLHAVVATHRHKDHISGFAARKNGRGAGNLIARCRPDLVLQPWTEAPDVSADSDGAFIEGLESMQEVSASLLRRNARSSRWSAAASRHIQLLAEENLPNRAAIENLRSMGRKNVYASFGCSSGLEELLPGVRTHVLGPPTVRQHQAIRKQRTRDEAEFWHLQAAAELYAGTAVFPAAKTLPIGNAPAYMRWFLRRMQSIAGEQALAILRTLDRALNNTSLILLFECGEKKLLFPGDAQIENWSYALSKRSVRQLLRSVDVYKVGHHGSLNATPKSLWNLFEKRSTKSLQTIVSTMAGRHGDARSGTEVPRQKLVEVFKAESCYFSTQLLAHDQLRQDFVIEL
jgi:hypothetical protein